MVVGGGGEWDSEWCLFGGNLAGRGRDSTVGIMEMDQKAD
jgi:hypothetical protein